MQAALFRRRYNLVSQGDPRGKPICRKGLGNCWCCASLWVNHYHAILHNDVVNSLAILLLIVGYWCENSHTQDVMQERREKRCHVSRAQYFNMPIYISFLSLCSPCISRKTNQWKGSLLLRSIRQWSTEGKKVVVIRLLLLGVTR